MEGGESNIGFRISKENNNNGRVFDLNLANVIKIKKSNDLPIKSKLNELDPIFLKYEFELKQ